MKALYKRWLDLSRVPQIITFCLVLSILAGVFAAALGQ